jgi:surface polysaccharide O-acyltransferase-like enzyme
MTLAGVFMLFALFEKLEGKHLSLLQLYGKAALTLYVVHLAFLQMLRGAASIFGTAFGFGLLQPDAWTGLFGFPQTYAVFVLTAVLMGFVAWAYVYTRRRTRHPIFSYI